MNSRKPRPKSYRPVRDDSEVRDRLNELLQGDFSLDKYLKGEILKVTLAPNETKIISHGLRSIPQYRIILRQTGNAVITDVDENWTEKTIGLLNNSANTVVLTIKLLPG